MSQTTIMTFSLQRTLYGVEAQFVREVFWLPELAGIAEMPDCVVGLANVRGHVVPVMDLNRRLGYPPQRYRTTDSVIVLECEDAVIGIIVNEVMDVRAIALDDVEPVLVHGETGTDGTRFTTRVAKADGRIIRLLDVQRVVRVSEPVEEVPEDEATDSGEPEPAQDEDADRYFCPAASGGERAVFADRAANLARHEEIRDTTGQQPYAVVELNREYFGVDLHVVQEFSDLGEVTPIPCSPEHIVGYMNLRGDVLTLVDMRNILKMPAQTGTPLTRVIVVRHDGLLAGVLVDEVLDLIYLGGADLSPVPASVKALGDGYLKGTAPYGARMLSLLDLPKILTGRS